MLLEAINIKKRFISGEGYLEVLKGADLTLEKGVLAVLSGQSGSGKSTLLYILGGLISPDEGRIEFKGLDINRFSQLEYERLRNKNVGFVFQMHHLMPDFTALENIMMPALIAGIGRHEAAGRAGELLSALSIYNRKDHYPNQLSGGEQQRTAVARALINSPDLILADEPTGNLDKENADSLIKLFAELVDTTGVSAIIATHNPELVEIGQIKFRLAEGRIVGKQV